MESGSTSMSLPLDLCECGHPRASHWLPLAIPSSACSASVDVRHPATGGDGLKPCSCQGYVPVGLTAVPAPPPSLGVPETRTGGVARWIHKVYAFWIHKVYAFVFGYFWTPCPSCGRWFGGHETGGGTLWMTGTATSRQGHLLCPRCPEDRYHASYPEEAVKVIDRAW